MRKAQYRFLRQVKQKTYTEERDNIVYNIGIDGSVKIDDFKGMYDEDIQEDINNMFDDTLYEKTMQQHMSKISVEYKNTDQYIQYEIDKEVWVSAKEARTSIEDNIKFIVNKNNEKSKKALSITDADTIYKPMRKMRRSGVSNEQYESIERIGFIEVTKKPYKAYRLNEKKQSTIIGILEDNIEIMKYKKLNRRKIGYLPIKLCDMQPFIIIDSETKQLELEKQQSRKAEQYVEIVENRGYKWLFILFMLIILTTAFVTTRDVTGWNFNLSNLTIYKTEEQTEYKENNIQFSLNVTPTLTNQGELNIGLHSTIPTNKEENDSINYSFNYTAKLYEATSNKLLWTQDNIRIGETIEVISIDDFKEFMEKEDVACILKCETYRDGKYLGELESDLTIHIAINR